MSDTTARYKIVYMAGSEIVGSGGRHDCLYEACAEAAARNLLEGECGDGQWTVVDPENFDEVGYGVYVEGDAIFDALIEKLNVNFWEALHLVERHFGVHDYLRVTRDGSGNCVARMADGFSDPDGNLGAEIARADTPEELERILIEMGVNESYVYELIEELEAPAQA